MIILGFVVGVFDVNGLVWVILLNVCSVVGCKLFSRYVMNIVKNLCCCWFVLVFSVSGKCVVN